MTFEGATEEELMKEIEKELEGLN